MPRAIDRWWAIYRMLVRGDYRGTVTERAESVQREARRAREERREKIDYLLRELTSGGRRR